MADIALMWDSKLLFEKFFIEHGFDHQLIHPANMGSPFLPPFKMVLIPTGFANPKYSNMLPSLMKNKRRIESFITKGGTLLVFGALTDSHFYEWLPVDLEYSLTSGPLSCMKNARVMHHYWQVVPFRNVMASFAQPVENVSLLTKKKKQFL
ncbi:MAG TPA: hypothetical protein VMW53_10075 [archaeon]|nr:hypothetical protein [archaeon]